MNNQPAIRVRFAPSPTGYLHIGGIRTALFNWLFARHYQGVFVLRIEDTDKLRSNQDYLAQILNDLRWLGLDWEEGPYFQSQRSAIYLENAQRLLKEEKAYADGSAIILRILPKSYEFNDLIRGPIKFEAGSFKDQVLIKSDGTPTYNFACVIDDHDMRISDIIRGDDHISNTPKQLAIYEALGFSPPKFAHIPLIVSADRTRLSKRKGAMPVSFYKEQGYLSEAMFNFLALLGWSPGDDQEIIPKQAIISQFSLERVLKSAAYFNPEKLLWLNGQYIQKLDVANLTELIIPFLLQKQYLGQEFDRVWLEKTVELFRPRMKSLSEFLELADFLFCDTIVFTSEDRELLGDSQTRQILQKLIPALDGLEQFDHQAVELACRSLIAAEKIKGGVLIHPTRLALTGKKTGPGLFELISVLGKQKTLQRLNQAIGQPA